MILITALLAGIYRRGRAWVDEIRAQDDLEVS